MLYQEANGVIKVHEMDGACISTKLSCPSFCMMRQF